MYTVLFIQCKFLRIALAKLVAIVFKCNSKGLQFYKHNADEVKRWY